MNLPNLDAIRINSLLMELQNHSIEQGDGSHKAQITTSAPETEKSTFDSFESIEMSHWFCCQCLEGPIALEDGNAEDSDLFKPEEICSCSHSRCHACEVAKNTSGDLLDKFLAELDNCVVGDGSVYHWLCCKCDEGPIGLGGLQDDDDKCSRRDCNHIRCDGCSVAKGTEDEEGNISWAMLSSSHKALGDTLKRKQEAESGTVWVINEDGGYEIDPLALSEQKLGVFKDMRVTSGESFTLNALPHIRARGLSNFGATTANSPNAASTPGETNTSTISSPRSPNGTSDQLEQPMNTTSAIDWECLVESKKLECLSRLRNARYRRDVRTGARKVASSSFNRPSDFVLVWEHAILPFLSFLVSEVCGPGFTVGLRRDRTPESRIISVMTEAKSSESQRSTIERHVRKIIPQTFQETAKFEFRTGTLRRSATEKPEHISRLDDICEPMNPYYYHQSTMEDSTGVARGQGDNHSTSTLGPSLIIGNQSYWLLNFHPLEKALTKKERGSEGLRIEHPSPDDRSICSDTGHLLSVQNDTDFIWEKLLPQAGLTRRGLGLRRISTGWNVKWNNPQRSWSTGLSVRHDLPKQIRRESRVG